MKIMYSFNRAYKIRISETIKKELLSPQRLSQLCSAAALHGATPPDFDTSKLVHIVHTVQ